LIQTGRSGNSTALRSTAKRYTLFMLDENGEPVMLRKDANNKTDRWSQHGLGHLLNPTDTNSGDRDWIGQVWLNMVLRAYRLPTKRLSFEDLPAVGRVSVGSFRRKCDPLRASTQGRSISAIKPFNFVLTCQVKQLGHPTGVEPERFSLESRLTTGTSRWIKADWIDQYTGNVYRITTKSPRSPRDCAREDVRRNSARI